MTGRPADPDPGPPAPEPMAPAPAPPPPSLPPKRRSSNAAIIGQSILIAVIAVLAGKLADRLYPQFAASGVVGAVIGGVVSGGLAVWFERRPKGNRPPHGSED
jgi:hypothetical protein